MILVLYGEYIKKCEILHAQSNMKCVESAFLDVTLGIDPRQSCIPTFSFCLDRSQITPYKMSLTNWYLVQSISGRKNSCMLTIPVFFSASGLSYWTTSTKRHLVLGLLSSERTERRITTRMNMFVNSGCGYFQPSWILVINQHYQV